MKKILLYAGLIACVAFPALAQQSSTAGSSSTSSSSAGSAATSNPNNQQNITFQGGGTSNNTNRSYSNEYVGYGGGTTNYSRNDGDVTVRNVPQVYAPPVNGGNPCTVGVSGGASFVGFGAALGGTFVDQDCADRQRIAMLHNAGYAAAAKNVMCENKSTYYAFRQTAQPCPVRPDYEKGIPPVASAQPVVPEVQPTPVQPVVTPVVAPRAAALPSRDNLPRCKGPRDPGPCFSG